MTQSTAREVLDKACHFHGALSEFYEGLRGIARGADVKHLLEYLSQHEKGLAQSLHEFEEHVDPSTLDSSVETEVEIGTTECLKDIDLKPDMSVWGVIRVALSFDNCLVKLYEEAASHADNEKVRTIFSDLADMEKADEVEIAHEAIHYTER